MHREPFGCSGRVLQPVMAKTGRYMVRTASILLMLIMAHNLLPAQVVTGSERATEQVAEQQRYPVKGVTRGALRYFGEKDDLTTVIMIIPAGEEVDIVARDGDHFIVEYDIYIGYLAASRVEVTEWSTVPPGEREEDEQQEVVAKGVTAAALRLFREMGDLTSVLMIIPRGSEIDLLARYEDFYLVEYGEHRGYLQVSGVELVAHEVEHVELDRQQAIDDSAAIRTQSDEQRQAVEQQAAQVNRLSYLEQKYGSEIAALIYGGRIWRGMRSEMVRDAWGSPERINRVIRADSVKEEWIYPTTWLLFERDTLREWGPRIR